MKAHSDYSEQPIDLGDIKTDGTRMFMATRTGWSCWMETFIQPGFLLGYPVEHWPFIARIKLENGSVRADHLRHLFASSGMGVTMALWMERLNKWIAMGATPDVPVEMILALGDWGLDGAVPYNKDGSWHQLHQLVLLCTQPNPLTLPYTEREKGLLTWR